MQEKQTDEAKEAGTGLAGTGGDQVLIWIILASIKLH